VNAVRVGKQHYRGRSPIGRLLRSSSSCFRSTLDGTRKPYAATP
jgi:hypothetical protein